jgi:mono/diheme cytochrome c family protein
MRVPFSVSALAALALLGAACADPSRPADSSTAAPPEPPSAAPAAAVESPPALPPAELSVLGEARRSSPVVAAQLSGPRPSMADPHGRVLIVADEEGDSLRVLDATSGTALLEAPVAGGPTHVLVASGGRVWVALRRANAVALLSLSEGLKLRELARARTAEEPVALALAEEPARLLVATGFGHTLEGFSPDRLEKAFSMDLAREPRSIAALGGHAFVAHMTGSVVSDIDLREEPPRQDRISLSGNDISMTSGCGSFDFSTFIPRSAVQGFAITELEGRLWLPMAFSRPASGSSSGYGSGAGTFRASDATVVAMDIATKDRMFRVEEVVFTHKKPRTRFDHFGAPVARTSAGKCLLPRAAAALPSSKHLLISCLGSDEVVEIDTEEKAFAFSFSRAFRVPSGPVGLAVDEARKEAFVWSAFDRAVSVLSLGDAKKAASEALSPARSFKLPPLPSEDARAALGRKMFHATFDTRVSADGRACASCHPDGRDDGLAWSSPKGPLQTPMLAGRLEGTAPYGWVGDAKTVGDHLHDTLVRLGGKGLKGAELEALVAFVTALPGPARHAAAADQRVARGKEIFESTDAMCTICHTQGGEGTDGMRHDVGSGLALETPTLRFVAGTAPYFHDGRYATLRELLTGSSGKMGGSLDGMTGADMDALEAYLLSL